MDYINIAKDVLKLYSIYPSEIQFIRHNENITYKLIDDENNEVFLLRIHKPITEGLFGLQHTVDGIRSEIKILQELNNKGLLYAQKPVANNNGAYITEYDFDNFVHPCYATILEWIEGETLSLEDDNIKEVAFTLGQNLALFHESLKDIKPTEDFIRPKYDNERIDSAIDELKYCVDANLFSLEHYDIIKKVLIVVKNQMNELSLKDNTFGIIHADIQSANIVINHNKPCLIDLGFSGFGYYAFDLGSAATIFPSKLRKTFLNGYSSVTSISIDDLKYIEGQIFMDTFISYVLFMRDNQRNAWIKSSALKKCDTLCKDFLEGKEVFYSL